LCGFSLPGLPMGTDGVVSGLGNTAVARRIIDSWMDHGELPPEYVAKVRRTG
jgi:hypothetical protein